MILSLLWSIIIKFSQTDTVDTFMIPRGKSVAQRQHSRLQSAEKNERELKEDVTTA